MPLLLLLLLPLLLLRAALPVLVRPLVATMQGGGSSSFLWLCLRYAVVQEAYDTPA